MKHAIVPEQTFEGPGLPIEHVRWRIRHPDCQSVLHGSSALSSLTSTELHSGAVQVASKTSLTALMAPDATVAPPGFYMLFLVSALGTPSVAKFVNVAAAAPPPPRRRPPAAPAKGAPAATAQKGATATTKGPPPPPPGAAPTGSLLSGQSLQQAGPFHPAVLSCRPVLALLGGECRGHFACV